MDIQMLTWEMARVQPITCNFLWVLSQYPNSGDRILTHLAAAYSIKLKKSFYFIFNYACTHVCVCMHAHMLLCLNAGHAHAGKDDFRTGRGRLMPWS